MVPSAVGTFSFDSAPDFLTACCTQDEAAAPGGIEQAPVPSSLQQDHLAAQPPIKYRDGCMALPEASAAADHGQFLNVITASPSNVSGLPHVPHEACYARS